jgi:spermidine synthase
LPALFVAAPRRAVGIALGTGQTFAAVFANGVSDLDIVEINPDVIRLSRHWFGEANDHLFERSGVHLHQDDGRVFLRATSERFDLIVLEPLQAWSAGTSSLYSHEFYEEARARLAPGGLLAQWIPLYGQGVDETRAMVRTAADVFPNASLWLDEHDGILMLREDSAISTPSELETRIAKRHLAADLNRKSLDGAVDVLALLVLGPEGVKRWTDGAAVISDDRPFLEFAAARKIGVDSFEPILRSVLAARSDTRAEVIAFAGEGPVSVEADAASRALTAEAILRADDYPARASLLEQGMASAPSSALLRRRYRSLMERWANEANSRNVPEIVLESILRRGADHDPGYGEAALNLGILALRHNDVPTARTWLERAARTVRVKDAAEKLLAQLR